MSMTTHKVLPQANGDFYAVGVTVSEEDQALLRRVRDFLEAEVAPIINQYWIREGFPHQPAPERELFPRYGCGLAYDAGGSRLASYRLRAGCV